MDHGGEAARPTTAWSAELVMAGAVRGSEANIGSDGFDGQLGVAPGSFSDFDLSAVAERGVVPVVLVGPQFHLHRLPGPGGVAYPTNIGAASWRQLGRPVDAVLLVGPQLPGGVFVPVHGNYSYDSMLQTRLGPEGARRGVVLGDLLPEDGGGGGAVYDWDYALQLRPGSGHGEVLVDQLHDGVPHGEVFVGQLQGGIGAAAAHDDLGAGYDALADDLGMGYDSRGIVAEHLRRLLPFAGVGASSLAINGLAAGPGSPAVAFHLFVLALGGLLLLILHVLRV